LEHGETLEQGAARETFEEAGLILDPDQLDLYSVMNMTATGQVAVLFRSSLASLPDIRPGPECLEVAFMSELEIPVGGLAWHETMGDGPRRFFDQLRAGRFGIELVTLGSNTGSEVPLPAL
jgi:ADP-ribose pyrophosphatase YjhB (NUDIX family)